VAKNPDEFAVNERVRHEQYGLGTILEVSARTTTIEFDSEGRRKFVTSIVKLERSTEAAPAPPPRKPRAKKATAKKVAAS